MEKTYKLLVADDHKMMRDGLRAMLSTEPWIEIVGEASDGREAVLLTKKLSPDVLLLDLSMPNTDGMDALHQVKRRYSEVKVVILTFRHAEEYVRSALRAGADAYVLKTDGRAELLLALRSSVSGDVYLSPDVSGSVVKIYLGGGESNNVSSLDVMTRREQEVVKLIAEGYETRGVATYLGISPKTVQKHRANAMKKLGLHNVSKLTAYAIENGIATP